MTGFVIWAALCALVAAAFIAVPLWRARPDRAAPQFLLGAAASLLVLSGAAALYVAWGHGSWRAATAPGGEGIATLLAATDARPDDLRAWLNLGRGYLRIGQWPLARRSFEHADRLGQGRNAEALGALAETSFFENNGALTPAVAEQFERALQLDPKLPAALFYTGVAQMNAGHLEIARARFAALRDLGPPPQVKAALDKQIAAIDADLARAQPDPATIIHLQVTLAPALAADAPKQGVLFVFVRAPQGGPPLAVKRLTLQFPQRVELSASDSMMASNRIKSGQRVEVMARISASGTPTASAGDLYGALTAVAGNPALRQLEIDRRSR
jgi:cytochrome c-type biogenesis protein CcmH